MVWDLNPWSRDLLLSVLHMLLAESEMKNVINRYFSLFSTDKKICGHNKQKIC
jgi:hypothetical protein